MPRTIESILANHDEATLRRKAGRPVWDRRIAIGPILCDESLTFEQTRDQVHSLLSNSAWVKESEEFSEIRSLVEDLKDVDDAEDFDAVLDFVYDAADAARVWLSG